MRSMPPKFSDSCSPGDPCQDPTEPSERPGDPMCSTPMSQPSLRNVLYCVIWILVLVLVLSTANCQLQFVQSLEERSRCCIYIWQLRLHLEKHHRLFDYDRRLFRSAANSLRISESPSLGGLLRETSLTLPRPHRRRRRLFQLSRRLSTTPCTDRRLHPDFLFHHRHPNQTQCGGSRP